MWTLNGLMCNGEDLLPDAAKHVALLADLAHHLSSSSETSFLEHHCRQASIQGHTTKQNSEATKMEWQCLILPEYQLT